MIRGASGWWITGALAALFVFMLVDAAVRPDWTPMILALPWMSCALIICWALLIHPCLIVTPSALKVVNILRVHTLPWQAIDNLTVRYQLVITMQDGSRLRAWGSPTTHPLRGRGDTEDSASSKTRYVGVVEAIERARDEVGRHPDAALVPRTRFAWGAPVGFIASAGLGVFLAQLLI